MSKRSVKVVKILNENENEYFDFIKKFLALMVAYLLFCVGIWVGSPRVSA